jgi:methylmalonyl-CoA mutase, C-terminal domain
MERYLEETSMSKNSKMPVKVLIGKMGLDGHERGAKVVSLGLRDEGMEVIYTGIRQSVENIVKIADEEDVDVVGISSLSGAHDLLPEVVEELKKRGMEDVLVICGGIIPDEDVPLLREKGISAVFGPGTPVPEIAQYIRAHIRRQR